MPLSIDSPVPSILIEGQPSTLLSSNLLSLHVEEDDLSGRHAVIEVSNPPTGSGREVSFAGIDNAHRIGTEVIVRAENEEIFRGKIVGHLIRYFEDEPPTLQLHLADALALLQRDCPVRNFEELSLADLVQEVANEAGLSAEVEGGEMIMSRVDQCGQSSWELVSTLLPQFGYFWHLREGFLHVAPATLPIGPGRLLKLGDALRSVEVEVDALSMPTEARSLHWDPRTADQNPMVVSKNWIQNQTTEGKSGPHVAHSAFGEMTQRTDNASAASFDLAQRRTQAGFLRTANGFVRAFGDARLQPTLRVGDAVDLQGIDEWTRGRYRVCQSVHTFDLENGARTAFVGERPSIGYTALKRKKKPVAPPEKRPTAHRSRILRKRP